MMSRPWTLLVMFPTYAMGTVKLALNSALTAFFLTLSIPFFAEAKPVVVLVHGINADIHAFDPLVTELGQESAVFHRFAYKDSQRLDKTAAQFSRYVKALPGIEREKQIFVVAHSLGGLIARRAMVENRQETLAGLNLKIQLVTIAAPFAGYWHNNIVHVLLFPVMKNSYFDLGKKSGFIRKPGFLGTNIIHTKIETLEDGKTRIDENGQLEKDEGAKGRQSQTIVDAEADRIVVMNVGHTGIISDGGKPNAELVQILKNRIFNNSHDPLTQE